MHLTYRDFLIRSWTPGDRQTAAQVIATVLAEYGLPWQPITADRDVLDIETAYHQSGGEFWVIEQAHQVMGTAAYYPIARGHRAVEIRKMYLLPPIRGQGLGKFLLHQLETAIAQRQFHEIWIETASQLTAAVKLYETAGYLPSVGVETDRCDRVYRKIIQP